MTIDELKHANDLVKQIEHTEHLAEVYRDAAEVIIGTNHPPGGFGGRLKDEITVTAAEIGDKVVIALECRLAAMKANLQKLGVE